MYQKNTASSNKPTSSLIIEREHEKKYKLVYLPCYLHTVNANSFFESVKCRKFQTVVATIFPLKCNENLNTFLNRLRKLFKGENYSQKYSMYFTRALL